MSIFNNFDLNFNEKNLSAPEKNPSCATGWEGEEKGSYRASIQVQIDFF